MRALRSEWSKLMRPGQLLGSWGTMAGFGLLLTLLLIARAGAEPEVDEFGNQVGGPSIPIALLERPDGWVLAFGATGQLLGIIALVIAAGNLAAEFTSGTLKGLLVREPRRAVLLGGKIGAVWAFIASGIALTLLVTVVASLALAGARGIATDAWFTAEGLGDLAQSLLNVTLAAMMWALMGTMLAMVFRSGPPAIGIGIGYPLLVEGLLGLVLPDFVRWMPGSVLAAVAAGSAESVFGEAEGLGYGAALVLSVAYAAAFLVISLVLLKRRDVL